MFSLYPWQDEEANSIFRLTLSVSAKRMRAEKNAEIVYDQSIHFNLQWRRIINLIFRIFLIPFEENMIEEFNKLDVQK